MDAKLNRQFELASRALSGSVFRFSLFPRGQSPGSALNRYGFLKDDWPKVQVGKETAGRATYLTTERAVFSIDQDDQARLALRDSDGKTLLEGHVEPMSAGGFTAEFDLSEHEMLFGLGDQTRERIEHRGTKVDMQIVNVSCYIPIPFLMSSRGYGIMVNTTVRHAWDLGADDGGKLRIYVPDRNLDIYVFYGPGLKDLLTNYTALTGRPALVPKWSLGLWFICRMQADDFQVVTDALNFRDRKIPCDVIGLEPGWMDKYYDHSVEKKWSQQRFPIPAYAFNGPCNFVNALKRMGYKLELWLCNDYDLSYEAERRIGNTIEPRAEALEKFLEDDTEKDTHFTEPVRLDTYTRPDEPWFEHLKKFVDQGADFFKQDGAMQVCDHPDRRWANGMTDDHMHNLYPLLYSQQMYEGFVEHTGRRPCCFTVAGWAGLQRYTGTWTGDTGGGPKTLVACLNLAMSGHSTVTCDMDNTTKEGIHYGFLMTQAQLDSWNYFQHPWLLGDELYPIFCEYARLRSKLIPYLYTYAHIAHTTGIPVMRPLVLEFPNDPKTPNILTQWFLGRELMVASFTEDVYLPEGKWYDYWTGMIYTGPETIRYPVPENRGGALFIRANSIVPFGPVVQYVGQKTDEGLTLEIVLEPSCEAEFQLYDDDGVTFDYKKGNFSSCHIRARYQGSVLSVETPAELNIEKVIVHTQKRPDKVSSNSREVSFNWSQGDNTLDFCPNSP